ncbi:MAG: hypothetical protein A2X94_15010 [Bdellovibrionales bacterium GWB1_55_8]|nr:MAG: hypothetical protein A2X94_15010 [Bdellovibrionales bacterium GWB1_55_8]
MRKRVFLIFAAVIALSIASLLWFIQTPSFARIAKQVAAKYLPADLGVEGDFSEFAVQLFPPGISLRNPKLSLREKNALNMPAGSSVHAERMDLNFRPFQMFSGNIRIHEVVIVNGEANLIVDPAAPARRKTKKTIGFRWDELVNIRADGVALENIRLAVKIEKNNADFSVLARNLRLSQGAADSDEPFYELSVDLTEMGGKFPANWSLPKNMPEIQAYARVDENGARIKKFQALFADGLNIESTGAIQGDLLNPGPLALDAEVRARGDLAPLLPKSGGRFQFDGKISGNLAKADETLKISGSLGAENGHYQDWAFDQVRMDASWSAGKDGGMIAVSQGTITAAEAERQGLRKPGRGGRIEIGPFQFKLSQQEALTVPLKLHRTHIHWLAAPALESIYPLQFRSSGSVTLTVSSTSSTGKSPAGWRVRAVTDLEIERLQLDNQRMERNKELQQVLDIPKIHVSGDLTVDRTGIFPGDLNLKLPQSSVKVTGKVDFKEGYDLVATGNVNLADIGTIADIPIRGAGDLVTHVHGPGSAIVLDFDTDIRDAYYLGMNLGALKGRISWDDDPENLLFSAIQLIKGETPYLGNGIIHLGDESSIQLDFRFARGNIQDLTSIFDELTADQAWFPKALRGSVKGAVKVTGGTRMDQLKVDARIDGTDWDFHGESFRQVRGTGGYDRGTFHLTDFEALKKSGTLAGSISFDRDQRFDWNIRTENLNVLDLDHFARLDVPIRGKISLTSEGNGTLGKLRSDTRASVSGFSVRGVPMPASQLRIKSETDALHVTAEALGGQGALELVYGFRPGTLSFFRAELQHLDFSPVLLLVNPQLAGDRSLTGFVSGAVNVSFRSGEAERGSGRVDISEYVLAKSNASFRLVRPISTKVTEGSFDLRGFSLRGPQGEAIAELRSNGVRLEGLISGEIDMSVLEFLVSPISRAAGTGSLNFAIAGTPKEPSIQGRVNLNGANVRVAALESPFENITGAIQLKQSTLTLNDIEADLAGGRLSAGGSVQIFADRFPSLQLKGILSGNKLRFFPFQFAKTQGVIKVTGDTIPYLVEGDVLIDSAISTEKVFSQKPLEGLKAARYLPPPTSRMESSYPKFRLNIKARAERGVVIQNELFDVEAKGNFTVVNTIETPRILGTAELVQGKLIFKNRSFQIQSASAQFDNPTVINPLFELIATTEVDNTKIQLYAAGRMEKWKIDLSSNPVMPESEILSLLALGLSSSDMRRLGAADRSVFERGEGLSLLLHSLDFNREVENKTGFQIQLGDAVDSQIGSSITRPQVQTDSIAAPKIVIKKQIARNLDLSYGSTLGIGENIRKEVNAEWRLSPAVSILGVWDNRETTDANKTSYGADLKLQRRFK